MQLVAGLGHDSAGSDLGQVLGVGHLGIKIYDDLEQAYRETDPQILIDFTQGTVAARHLAQALKLGMNAIIGTTALPTDGLREAEKLAAERHLGAAVIANFSLGAHLLTRLAREAGKIFTDLEIIELHASHKLDRPSGTAKYLAANLARDGQEIPIHSIRLPGLVAHQEVIFGGQGETLTLRHDVISREAYAPGVIKAIRGIRRLDHLVYDLGDLLDK